MRWLKKCMKWGGKVTHEERRAFLVENGICTRCGKALAAKERNLCPACLDYVKIIYEHRKARTKLYYQTNAEELKASHRRLYYERKEKGLCVCCGKSAPVEGLTRCQKCREKVNADYRRRYHEQKDIDMCDLMCR